MEGLGGNLGGRLNPMSGLFGLAMSPRSASHRPNYGDEAIMLVKLSIILFSISHNFIYYAHRFYLLFSKFFLV